MKIKITGIGSYIPEMKVANTDFNKHVFLNEDGSPFAYPNDVVIEKFKSITESKKDVMHHRINAPLIWLFWLP